MLGTRKFLLLASACLAATALSGCVTLADMAGIPHTGLQPDGSYLVTAEEKALGCRDLSKLVYRQVEQMQKLPEQMASNESVVPSTVAAVFGQASGKPALTEYETGRKRAEALNAALVDKNCPAVNLNAALNESDVVTSALRHN